MPSIPTPCHPTHTPAPLPPPHPPRQREIHHRPPNRLKRPPIKPRPTMQPVMMRRIMPRIRKMPDHIQMIRPHRPNDLPMHLRPRRHDSVVITLRRQIPIRPLQRRPLPRIIMHIPRPPRPIDPIQHPIQRISRLNPRLQPRPHMPPQTRRPSPSHHRPIPSPRPPRRLRIKQIHRFRPQLSHQCRIRRHIRKKPNQLIPPLRPKIPNDVTVDAIQQPTIQPCQPTRHLHRLQQPHQRLARHPTQLNRPQRRHRKHPQQLLPQPRRKPRSHRRPPMRRSHAHHAHHPLGQNLQRPITRQLHPRRAQQPSIQPTRRMTDQMDVMNPRIRHRDLLRQRRAPPRQTPRRWHPHQMQPRLNPPRCIRCPQEPLDMREITHVAQIGKTEEAGDQKHMTTSASRSRASIGGSDQYCPPSRTLRRRSTAALNAA